MPMKRATFRSSDLVVVGGPYPLPGTTGPVAIGDRVELASGSPELIVVDIDGDRVTAALREAGRESVEEVTLPRICWRRLP
jgi:hypothetical protein